MKKTIVYLLLFSLITFAWEETITINKCVTQMCGFTLGEKLKQNRFVIAKKVKWVRHEKNENFYACIPPINFMNATACGINILNDGRISAIAISWNNFDLIDLDKRAMKFDEIRKSLAIIFKIPEEKLNTIGNSITYKTNLIYKNNNIDEAAFILEAKEDGMIILILTSEPLGKLYNKEQEERIRRKALQEDAKAFGL